jgi:hypothetical protein
MKQHKLYVKLSKCEFWLDEIVFLGHVISKNSIYVDHKKVETVLKWERPMNVIEIHSFMRLTGIIVGL